MAQLSFMRGGLLRASLLSIAALITSFVLLMPAAHAADTVIGFDDVPPNTPITTQYHALGVDFELPPYGSLPASSQIPAVWCCIPITRTSPPGHSSQVASISWSSTEIWTPGVFGAFATYRQHVQVSVGSNFASDTAQVTLTAFDINGSIVGNPATGTVTGSSSPVTLTVTVPSGPVIAYFLVQSAETNKYLWIDDLTFDNPATAPPPDFVFDVQGFVWPGSAIVVGQGGSTTVPLPIRRLNGSNGNITLSVNGMPAGVSATFSPQPIAGTGTTTNMTLSAAGDALFVDNSPVTVIGTPSSPAVAPAPRSGQLLVTVIPAVTISTDGWGSTYQVVPCTALNIGPIYVNKDATAVAGDVTLALRVSLGGGFTGDLPSGIHASFDPPVSPQSTPFSIHTLKISLDPGALNSSQLLDVVVVGTSSTATGGTLTTLSQPFALQGVGQGSGSIDQVTPSAGRTPQLLQPGTQVVITGVGFCLPLKVQFGNAQAVVAPDTATLTEVRATVPRLATTGPISLVPSEFALTPEATIVSPSQFAVDSYRNTFGFSFVNYKPNVTFGQLTEAFGSDQTYFKVDFCPPFGCTVSFPDPEAAIILTVANGFFSGSGGGACFGFALASQRFRERQRAVTDFPATWNVPAPGAGTPYSLDGPGFNGRSGAITDYINTNQVSEISVEMLNSLLGQRSQSVAAFHDALKAALANGETPLVSLTNLDTQKGHVVVAYDLEDHGPYEFLIYVYDSNAAFLAPIPGFDDELNPNGNTHASRVTNSIITVTPDENYNLPSSGLTGQVVGGLFLIRASNFPTQPTLPTLAGVSNLLMLGSTAVGNQPTLTSRVTQVMDDAGHTLFDSSGHINKNPATRLDAVPFVPLVGADSRAEAVVVASNTSTITQTIVGSGGGFDSHFLFAAGFAARVDTLAAPGISDQLAFDPTGGVSFATQAAHKEITTSVAARVQGGVRSAEVTTTIAKGTVSKLSLDATRTTLVYRNSGPAAPLRLRLSSLGTAGTATTFESEPMQIGPGETATFTLGDWARLDVVAMTLRDLGGRERHQILQNQFERGSVARIVALDIDERHQEESNDRAPQGELRLPGRAVEVISRLEQVPPHSQVAITWTVRKEGRIVGHGAEQLDMTKLHPGDRRDRFSFEPGGSGHFSIRADLVLVTADGLIESVRRDTRSADFDIP
jgi:hypothetical protein